MSAAPNRPLILQTLRATGLSIVAFVAWVSAIWTRRGCHDMPGAVASPTPGTPRAGYCGAIGGVPHVLTMTLVPTALAAIIIAVCWARPRVGAVLLGAVLVAVVADAVIANTLTATTTI